MAKPRLRIYSRKRTIKEDLARTVELLRPKGQKEATHQGERVDDSVDGRPKKRVYRKK